MRRTLASLAVIVTLLTAGCSIGAPPDNVAATVNGKDVPISLYESLTKLTISDMRRAGVAVNPATDTGRGQLQRVHTSALKNAIRDTLIDQLGRSRKLTVSAAELDAGIAKIQAAVGGPDQFKLRLEAQGITEAEFRTIYHFNLLDQKLRAADPNGYDKALAKSVEDAKVTAYVGPCSSDHEYPKCAG